MSGPDSKDHRIISAMWEVAMAALAVAVGIVALGFLAHVFAMLFRFGWGAIGTKATTSPVSVPAGLVSEPAPSAPAGTLMVSSWYGGWHHGRLTASGERFNQHAMTAAHRTMPFGTRLRLSVAGKTAIVQINDRGPFHPGRDLDVSLGTAQALGMVEAGVAVLQVEAL
jgi:rare lipoprotein A (peptidoglycan hydrolase)